jgi:hypothetical protein
MRITNLTQTQSTATARVEANMIWEDSDRPTRTIFFETSREFADYLTCNPHAFLVGCLWPAYWHGEKRLSIDETICPELRDGLKTNMAWLREWSEQRREPMLIEAKAGVRQPVRRPAERVGAFLSGGVDSLATLRVNRLNFPLAHPRFIKDCLLVHGFDIGGRECGDEEIDSYERAIALLSPIAQEAHITLIPVFTNIRHLDDDVGFWIDKFFGAALASVAHVFSNRLSTVLIASGLDVPNVRPTGGASHPLLDPNYSSADLQLRHDGLRFSRFDKVKLLADWDVALKHLRVCTMNPADVPNCGRCEKCIRTMLELLAVGKLAETPAFPANDVSEELLSTVDFQASFEEVYFQELIAPLTAVGRPDLVRVIETKSKEFHKRLAWEEERDWKGIVKKFDRKYLGSSMYKSYKALRASTKRGTVWHMEQRVWTLALSVGGIMTIRAIWRCWMH